MCGEMEKHFEFIMAPEEVALEHCEIDNVGSFSVEFERVDDGESSKGQNLLLECECGGERDWSEGAPVDGNGSLVETLAQDWSPVGRERQPTENECLAGLVTWPELTSRRSARTT